MPLQRNTFTPVDLLKVYDSPSGMRDTRTGDPYQAGGLMVGIYIDMTEAEAQMYGRNQLHEGRYRFVQIDSAATAAKVIRGTIGGMRSLALGVNVVTDFDQCIGGSTEALLPRGCVFLNNPTAAQITAGAYVWVQELGDASVLLGAQAAVAAAGVQVEGEPTGVVDTGTNSPVGVSLEAGVAGQLFRCMLTLPVIQG